MPAQKERKMRVIRDVLAAAALVGAAAYMYLCTFPGHNSAMRGMLKFG
jgi:azurin